MSRCTIEAEWALPDDWDDPGPNKWEPEKNSGAGEWLEVTIGGRVYYVPTEEKTTWPS